MNVWLPCSEVCRRNYRPRKFVIVLRWLVYSCVLLSEAWRHVCRPTRCLLLRRQSSSMSTVDRMCILVHHIHVVDLPVLRPPDWPCNVCLVSCQRVWSVHCSQPTRTARACHVCIWETVLTEWIALEHGVILLQQWRHRICHLKLLSTLNVHFMFYFHCSIVCVLCVLFMFGVHFVIP